MQWLQRLLGNQVTVTITTDHLELSDSYTVLGLKLSWHNGTSASIFAEDVQLNFYPRGRKQSPFTFSPVERFARSAGQRAFLKSPLTSFMLRSKKSHEEQIRFICKESVDIPAGDYLVDVRLTDVDKTVYLNKTRLLIESKIMFRSMEEWSTD